MIPYAKKMLCEPSEWQVKVIMLHLLSQHHFVDKLKYSIFAE